MKRLEIATEELDNIWCSLFYADGDEVQIHKDGKVMASRVLDDCNDDNEVAEFIEWFVNE